MRNLLLALLTLCSTWSVYGEKEEWGYLDYVTPQAWVERETETMFSHKILLSELRPISFAEDEWDLDRAFNYFYDRSDYRKMWHLLASHYPDISDELIYVAGQGKLELVDFLIELGADPTARGAEALREASKRGHTEVVKLLLDKRADPTAKERTAADSWLTEVINLWIYRDMGPRAWKSEALKMAADNGHTEVVKLLLDKGADATEAGVGRALFDAVSRKDDELVAILLEAGAESVAGFVKAAEDGDTEVVMLFIESGMDVNSIYEKSRLLGYPRTHSTRPFNLIHRIFLPYQHRWVTALEAAVANEDTKMVYLLLEAGADPTAIGSAAIKRAVGHMNWEILKDLLRVVKDPVTEVSVGMEWATAKGQVKLAEVLPKAMKVLEELGETCLPRALQGIKEH